MTKLLLDVGEACAAYRDEHLRDLGCKTIEADEIWSFAAAAGTADHIWTCEDIVRLTESN